MSDHLLTIIELGLVFSNILFSLVHVLIMLYYTIIFEKFYWSDYKIKFYKKVLNLRHFSFWRSIISTTYSAKLNQAHLLSNHHSITRSPTFKVNTLFSYLNNIDWLI